MPSKRNAMREKKYSYMGGKKKKKPVKKNVTKKCVSFDEGLKRTNTTLVG
jgi:hypothetical protein